MNNIDDHLDKIDIFVTSYLKLLDSIVEEHTRSKCYDEETIAIERYKELEKTHNKASFDRYIQLSLKHSEKIKFIHNKIEKYHK